MTTPSKFETVEAIRLWLIDETSSDLFKSDRDTIDMALIEWAFESTSYDEGGCTAKALVERLETINCSGCNAPSGLIYNHEIAAKVPNWFDQIDDCLDAYKDATGEDYSPQDGQALTIGSLVWFAVEWRSNFLGDLIRSIAGLDD